MKRLLGTLLFGVWLAIIGKPHEAYATSCTLGTLSACASPLYNSPVGLSFVVGGQPFAGAWAGTGFGYSSAPSVAQMVASLSASPQPLTVSSLTSTGTVTGATVASNGAVTGVTGTITDTSTSDTAALTVSAVSDTNGVNLKLTGNGATTPVKTLRVQGGTFYVYNNAGSSILSLTDAGDLGVTNIDNTPIGATTPAAGAFTTLSSSGAFTPSGGIVGNTTGATPSTGNVGYPYTASNSGVTITANLNTNMTSIPLPAGNYNCGGDFGLGTPAAADNNIQAYLSTVSQSPSGIIQPAEQVFTLSTGGVSSGTTISTGNAPLLLTSPKTLYLVVYSYQATTGSSGNIYCTRVQ